MTWPIGHNSACLHCAGSGAYVATQDMAEDHSLPGYIVIELRMAAPMPAIVTCPACDGTGSGEEP